MTIKATMAMIWTMTGALAASGPAGGKVLICVNSGSYELNPSSMAVLTRAEDITSRMFQSAGVAVEWRSAGFGVCRRPQQTQTIVLDFATGTPASQYPGALAYALPHEGVHIVMLDRIEKKAAGPAQVPLLARVLTHEVTHILMPATGLSDAERPELILRIYDLAGMGPSDLGAALSQTALVLDAAGIDLVWQTGDPSSPEAHLLDASTPKESVRLPHVVVVRITGKGGFPAEALGRSLPFAQSGAHISIFLDHIRQRQARGNVSAPKLLGYALAHELGHVLMQSGEHTARGLMRSEWGDAEFQRIEHGALKFTQSQALTMRAALHSLEAKF